MPSILLTCKSPLLNIDSSKNSIQDNWTCLEQQPRKKKFHSHSCHSFDLAFRRATAVLELFPYSPFPPQKNQLAVQLPTIISPSLLLPSTSSLSASDVNSGSVWWFWYELWSGGVTSFCFPVCGMDPNVVPLGP